MVQSEAVKHGRWRCCWQVARVDCHFAASYLSKVTFQPEVTERILFSAFVDKYHCPFPCNSNFIFSSRMFLKNTGLCSEWNTFMNQTQRCRFPNSKQSWRGITAKHGMHIRYCCKHPHPTNFLHAQCSETCDLRKMTSWGQTLSTALLADSGATEKWGNRCHLQQG